MDVIKDELFAYVSRVVNSKLGGFYQFFTNYFPTYFPTYFASFYPAFIANNSADYSVTGTVGGFNGSVTAPYYAFYNKSASQRIAFCRMAGTVPTPAGAIPTAGYVEVTMSINNANLFIDFDLPGVVLTPRAYVLPIQVCNIVSGVTTFYPASITVTVTYDTVTIISSVDIVVRRYTTAGVAAQFTTGGVWQIFIPPVLFTGPAYYN